MRKMTKRMNRRIIAGLLCGLMVFETADFSAFDQTVTVEAATSEATLYGFSVQSYASTDTYKTYAVSRNDDGTNTYTVEFRCDAEESWIDSEVTFEVEDVTPTAYRQLFEDVGVSYVEPVMTVSSDASYIKEIHAMGYTMSITTPFSEDGAGGFEGDAVSGKVITVEAGASTKVVKISAIKDGDVIDYIYVGTTGKDSSGSYTEYDLALYQQVRQYVESQIWTDDMTNLEKIVALAAYINKTTHYPYSATTEKESNPTFWENWSVDDKELYYGMFNDIIMNRIMDLQGGIVTCLAAQLLSTAAQEDLGLTYLYSSSTGVAEEGEGVWLVSGSYSSNPTNPYHYSLKYRSADGTTALIDAQGMSYSSTSSLVSCEAHGCADYIVDLDFTFDPPTVELSTCTVSLSSTSLTYNGKARTPSVTITSGNKTLTQGTDYKVSYSNNTNVGTATVTITGIGNYTGTVMKTFTIKPAASSISSVKNTTSGISVTWKKVTGATGYYIYRKTGSGSWSKYKTITSGSTVSFTDTAVTSGKSYSYRVYAYASTGTSSASASKTLRRLSGGKISSLTNTSSGIIVKWSKITGASGYYIYRKSSGGSYSLIKTITSGSTVSYTDTVVKSKNGTTYLYYVVPYYKNSSGAIAKGTYANTKTTVRLTTVSLSSVKNSSSKKMTVKWAKNSKATGYQIQYSTSASFASGNKTVTVSGASSVSKVISSLAKGKTYYVRIRAYKTVSGTKYYSAWSSKKSVKISK